MKKYEFTGEEKIVHDGERAIMVRRIRALSDFANVHKGSVGGWIEHEENLSHEGNCWVFDNAVVFDNARVYGNARLFGDVRVYHQAQIFDNATVCDYAEVFGDAHVYEQTEVMGIVKLHGFVTVHGETKLRCRGDFKNGTIRNVCSMDPHYVQLMMDEAEKRKKEEK